jgi:hypothetical protein
LWQGLNGMIPIGPPGGHRDRPATRNQLLAHLCTNKPGTTQDHDVFHTPIERKLPILFIPVPFLTKGPEPLARSGIHVILNPDLGNDERRVHFNPASCTTVSNLGSSTVIALVLVINAARKQSRSRICRTLISA